MNTKSSQVVRFAIDMETSLHAFYVGASQRSRFRRIQDMFLSMAGQKADNKKQLGSFSVATIGPDFDFENYALFRKIEIGPAMSYQEIRKFSILLEENVLSFYSNLAEFDQEDDVEATFLSLAQGAKQHIKVFEDQTFGK